MEQKKDNISSKNAQIERIQQRIENIKNDLLTIKDGFVGLPNYIDKRRKSVVNLHGITRLLSNKRSIK